VVCDLAAVGHFFVPRSAGGHFVIWAIMAIFVVAETICLTKHLQITTMTIEIGIRHTSRVVVDSSNVASAVGSGGLDVFATPSMVALMENAAMTAVAPFLEEGQTTVGGHINTSHLAPSPVGATIEAEAVVTAVEGRKIEFAVEARCDGKVIGNGTHLRFVVDAAKFMSKLL